MNTAVPVESTAAGVAFRGVPLSKNCTNPVGDGRPAGNAETTAVNVTGWPRYVGLADAVSVVVVGIGTTLSLSGAEAEGASLGSPEYCATMVVCVPVGNDEGVNTAVPVVSSGTVANGVPLSRNVTLPVGVEVPDVWAPRPR